MNINDLTIGQVKEIKSVLGFSEGFGSGSGLDDGNFGMGNGDGYDSGAAPPKKSILDGYVGKYVICRSRNEGVNAGRVLMLDETGVVLADARRLYYHKPANKNISWYEGVAKCGLSSDSKVGAPVEKVIVEDYSLTVCTEEAEKSLVEAKNHEQG